MDFFLLSPVSDKIFYNLPVHKRFSAEKVYFQISSFSRIRNKEIKRFFSYFIRHKRPASMIFPFFCEAVSAGQITVMCDVQAKRLDNCFSLLHFINVVFINISRKKSSLLRNRCDSFQNISYIFFCVCTSEF